MFTLFFLTPLEIVAAFIGGVLGLLGIGAKTSKRNLPPKGKRKRRDK